MFNPCGAPDFASHHADDADQFNQSRHRRHTNGSKSLQSLGSRISSQWTGRSNPTLAKSLNESSIEMHESAKGISESEIDIDFVDKLLTEGIRLKKKCKSLKELVKDIEEQRTKDLEEYEKLIEKNELTTQGYISEIQSQHYIEASALKADHQKSVHDLTLIIRQNKEETQRQERVISNLQQQIIEYQKSRDDSLRLHVIELEEYSRTMKSEKKIFESRQHILESDYKTTLERALLAETKYETLESQYHDHLTSSNRLLHDKDHEIMTLHENIVILSQKIDDLSHATFSEHETLHFQVEDLHQTLIQCQDENHHLQQEKSSLESQLHDYEEKHDELQLELQHVTKLLSSYQQNISSIDGTDSSIGMECMNCEALQSNRYELLDILRTARDEILSLRAAIEDIMIKKELVLADVSKVIAENDELKKKLSISVA